MTAPLPNAIGVSRILLAEEHNNGCTEQPTLRLRGKRSCATAESVKIYMYVNPIPFNILQNVGLIIIYIERPVAFCMQSFYLCNYSRTSEYKKCNVPLYIYMYCQTMWRSPLKRFELKTYFCLKTSQLPVKALKF